MPPPLPCPQDALTVPSQCPLLYLALTMPIPPFFTHPHSGPTMLQISTCNDLTSSSCELTADAGDGWEGGGGGFAQSLTQLPDTSYQFGVQVCGPALCTMQVIVHQAIVYIMYVL